MKKKMHFLGLIFLTIRIQTKKKKKKTLLLELNSRLCGLKYKIYTDA